MGALLRRYWVPALLAAELPEPDGRPVRVPLLGERLVAFRDASGQVGLLEEACPHRGASLALGRNEDGGLRCIYHGWQFDRTGRCLDMPTERAGSPLPERIRARAYPTREAAGIVWAYLGPGSAPHFPAFQWLTLYPERSHPFKILEECNWAQALEGGIDSSHSSFLHSNLNSDDYTGSSRRGMMYKTLDKHPRFEVVDTEYGVLVGARRDAEVDSYYWRITQFLLPFFQMIPAGMAEGGSITGHAWVPIDDHHCWAYTMTWNPTRPVS